MTNGMENNPDAAPLAEVARLGLSAGRILLESGANGRIVHEAVADIAEGLRCDSTEVICQHAAVLVMIRRGEDHCMQMGKAGEHGVNLRRAQAVRRVIRKVRKGELGCAAAQAEMDLVPSTAPRYPVWFVCLSTGLACGAFGRLIACSSFDKLHGRDWSTDWAFFVPTVAGTAIGQFTRHTLFHHGHNIFLTAGVVSFVSAFLAGIGAKLVGSASASLAMVAAVLLLVPGVAVLNAQVDILEAKPNLAAARALRVLYLLLFMALGLALAQSIVLRQP